MGRPDLSRSTRWGLRGHTESETAVGAWAARNATCSPFRFDTGPTLIFLIGRFISGVQKTKANRLVASHEAVRAV